MNINFLSLRLSIAALFLAAFGCASDERAQNEEAPATSGRGAASEPDQNPNPVQEKTMTLKLEKISDTKLRGTRVFRASKQRLFDAHFKPELVRQWMLGLPGWSMPECEIKPEVGAEILYVWIDDKGQPMKMTGKVTELDAPHRSVHTERYDYPGATETVVETLYKDHPDGSELEVTMTFPSAEALIATLESDIEEGMELSYQGIDALASR